MDNKVLETSQRLGGYVKRRAALLGPLCNATHKELEDISEVHDWNSIPLALFLNGPPFSYYSEPAFVEYYAFLEVTYKDLAQLASDFKSCGYDTFEAMARAENLLLTTAQINLDDYDDFQKVTNYLNPWYLELVEQVFDCLLALPAFSLQQQAGKQLTRTVQGIFDVLIAHGWRTPTFDYSATMRNGIAHETKYETDGFGISKTIYTDKKGNSEALHLEEVEDRVFGLLDTCLGYVMAIRLFLFVNRTAPELDILSNPATIPFWGRSNQFAELIKLPYFDVVSVHKDIVNDQVQIRLECEDRTYNDAERMMGIAATLAAASHWFHEADMFFIGLTGKRRWKSGARVQAGDLRQWVSGDMTDSDFFDRFEREVLWPLRRFAGRTRSTIRYSVGEGVAEGRRQWQEIWGNPARSFKILSIEDNSIAIARRYRCELLSNAASQDEIRSGLPHIVSHVRSKRVYRNRLVRKAWRWKGAQYVDGFIYSREKRRRDRWADTSSQFYIGRFEWRDQSVDQDNLPIPLTGDTVVDLGGGLYYEPNSNWPPPNVHLPAVNE